MCTEPGYLADRRSDAGSVEKLGCSLGFKGPSERRSQSSGYLG